MYKSSLHASPCSVKAAFHDIVTDILADILARIVARMSVSVSWNAGFINGEHNIILDSSYNNQNIITLSNEKNNAILYQLTA